MRLIRRIVDRVENRRLHDVAWQEAYAERYATIIQEEKDLLPAGGEPHHNAVLIENFQRTGNRLAAVVALIVVYAVYVWFWGDPHPRLTAALISLL